ncbi:hypothetical protein LUZ63_014558 [Rhynchospora breviuscula]|uniref:Cytochrome P450 n=1 Tax=Rhynchospora breviuscula TaxID=2022672 RepID=A0A9Q0HLS7_9POAL|nr:hypothetical protein LUZ63_014558 [Rhynchospora breviuscula]
MVLLPVLCLTVCCVLFLHLLHWRCSVIKAAKYLPPSPPKLPLIGNLHQLGHLPHRSLHDMSKKYGPIMLLHLGNVPTLVISSADMAAEVLKAQDHIFSSRPGLKVPKRLFYGGKDIAFAPYGEYWRQCRKLAMLHLLSSKKVQSFRHIREEEVSRMIDLVSSKHILGPIDMTDEFSFLAKQTISRISIGQHSGKEDWYKEIQAVMKECSVMMSSFNPGDYFTWLPWLSHVTGLEQKLKKTCEWRDRVLDAIIENQTKELRGGQREECFVDIVLNLTEDESKDIYLGRDNIKAIIMDTFGAGTESTSITMNWVMAELIRNPQVMKKLQYQIRSIACSRSLIQEEDLAEMAYLKAVIKEALRLHPTGPLLVPRELIQDTTIKGYHIPCGALVLVNVWAIGRDPKIWDNPDDFRPERFLGSQVDYKGQDFELIPFGAGRRVCPGIGFAMPIVELAIANLLLKFDWSIADSGKAEEMNMEEVFGLTLRKKTGLYAVATPHYP